jgi:glucose/arabinose dehydrogenase/PKD repeat protein
VSDARERRWRAYADEVRHCRAAALVVSVLLVVLALPSAAGADAGGLPGVAGAGLGAAPRIPSFAPAAVPAGFEESVAFSGLTNPTSIRFAPDGRVFVAEKSGLIVEFDSVDDPSPTVYADLRDEVHDFWDRGLLGLALDPGFDSGRPYVYVAYAYNKDPRSPQMPRWPDGCPDPPGATDQGCVVSGRLSRLENGVEHVLIEDWCQQYPSHTVGSIAFGTDGSLYLSGGEGANFNWADFGQVGGNPCADPTDEGGALRAQDLRTAGDPTTLDGTVIRVSPDTGAPLSTNPGFSGPDTNAKRIVAYGLRNPFRMAFRPGTDDLYVGDVGWDTWEELDRDSSPTSAVRNYGWPCYEGPEVDEPYADLQLSHNLCQGVYAAGAATAPLFAYRHADEIVPGEACATGSSSISGLAWDEGPSFPAAYRGALFFADYSRNCIWVMFPDASGAPDPATVQTFASGADGPVDLQFGPDGALYYPDLNDGTIKRIAFADHAPTARATAQPSHGTAPLTVQFDAGGSTDPDGDALHYDWDLDGDGQLDDSTAVSPTFTYTTAGVRTVRLRVTDTHGETGTATVTVTVGGPPTVTISEPAATLHWVVGDEIHFAGSARDSAGNPLPPSALTWQLDLRHCPSTCHTHPLETFTGVSAGSFIAPDHEYPSHLELRLTATDSAGVRANRVVRLNPTTTRLRFASSPSGLQLAVGPTSGTTPFGRTVIVGSANSVAVPSPQTQTGVLWNFASWSDGGAATHTIVAPAASAAYTATFADTVLLGDDKAYSAAATGQQGTPRAWKTTALRSGTLGAVHVALASDSTAGALVTGVYTDRNGAPDALLASARLNAPSAGHWSTLPVASTQIVAGRSYWIAVLAPSGTLRVRSGLTGGVISESTATGRTALPQTWSQRAQTTGGRLSAAGLAGP